MSTAAPPPPASVAQWVATLRQGSGIARLGRGASRMLTTIAREPQFASYASTGELAARADINPSSVTRVSQSFGYGGWPDFRRALRGVYVRSVGAGEIGPVAAGEAANSLVARSIDHDLGNLAQLLSEQARSQIEAIGACIGSAPRTVVVGSGLGAVPAGVFGHLGLVSGFDIRLAFGAPTAQIAEILRLTPGDCVLAINVWRTTTALRALVELARERELTVCLLTDIAGSRLAALAEHVVVAPTTSVGPAPSLTAMTSAAHAIIHATHSDAALAHGRAVERAWDAVGLIDDDE